MSATALICLEVGAGAARNVVLGCTDQEFSRRVELVSIPAGAEHSLAEDQVHVSRFTDAEAYPHVHLRSDGTLSHGFLRWPLGRGYQCYG